MDSSSQFIVPTIIDVPELIVTNEDVDYDDSTGVTGRLHNRLQFLASTLSYTLNLGTIWRFPYLCYKYGGGAFLIAYSLAFLIVGMPLFLMELAFGQYANEGPITIWRISPAFEGIGYSMCLISAMVAIYYNIINTWIIHYLFAAMTFGQLPWSTCDNSWNTAKCFLKADDPTIIAVNCSSISLPSTLEPQQPSSGNSSSNSSILYEGNCNNRTVNSHEFERVIKSDDDVSLPANEYFHNSLLTLTNSMANLGPLNWTTFFGLALAWALVFAAILKDIRPSCPSRLALATFIGPYLALAALLVRALTLPGSLQGLVFYLSADYARLQNLDIWADATTQTFFALAPCWGAVITLASMNKFHNNFHADALWLVAVNYGTSLFSGLVTFAILGHMANYSGIDIGEVVDSGLGFIFMVYTEALVKLPLANLNSMAFFGLLLLIGLTSQFTVIETVLTTIVDTWPHKLRYRKPLILMILCSLMSFLGLTMCFGNGFYVLQLVDQFAGTYTALVVGLLELIAIAWVYGMENFMQDIDDMISQHRNLFPSRAYWHFMWRYLAPSALFAVLLFCLTDLPQLQYRGFTQPPWTLKFGWILTAACLAIVPAIALLRFLLSPGGSFHDKLSYLCKPSEDWAPSSYISGPKLLNRHMMEEREFEPCAGGRMDYSDRPSASLYQDQDQESNESNEDLKVVDGRANYIIPEEEEEEDTDTGLITSETNV